MLLIALGCVLVFLLVLIYREIYPKVVARPVIIPDQLKRLNFKEICDIIAALILEETEKLILVKNIKNKESDIKSIIMQETIVEISEKVYDVYLSLDIKNAFLVYATDEYMRKFILDTSRNAYILLSQPNRNVR